jgi:transglutaminase-like putative cysteine protease
MKLNVTHTTAYHYETPQKAVLQSLRLVPSDFAGQQVVDWSVTIDGGISGSQFRDGAGDVTETWRVRGPVEAVEVQVKGTVDTTDLAGVLRGHREKVPPMAYLRSTRMTRTDMALADLAETALAPVANGSTLDKAHALADAIAASVVFTSGATNSTTTASEALAEGKGVCQDFAHLMIAAAIANGIPARYVTGYLFAGDDADVNLTTAAAASHAWAELFIDGLGWVGFDPSNACCPDDRYIRLCSGFDAFDAAPIRGLASGTGDERLTVAVAVSQEQQ